jgi:hypothetical protein
MWTVQSHGCKAVHRLDLLHHGAIPRHIHAGSLDLFAQSQIESTTIIDGGFSTGAFPLTQTCFTVPSQLYRVIYLLSLCVHMQLCSFPRKYLINRHADIIQEGRTPAVRSLNYFDLIETRAAPLI